MDTQRIVEELTVQVRDAVLQAEEKAAKIVTDAERDAERIRSEAEEHARRQRDDVRRALSQLQSGGSFEPVEEVEPDLGTAPKSAPIPSSGAGRRRFRNPLKQRDQASPSSSDEPGTDELIDKLKSWTD